MTGTPQNTLDPTLARIEANPEYQALRSRRNRLAWLLTIVMLVSYFGFIGLIAFDKEFLAQRIGTGVTTIGIPIALGLIVFTVLLTALYVWRANNAFDRMVDAVLREARA